MHNIFQIKKIRKNSLCFFNYTDLLLHTDLVFLYRFNCTDLHDRKL